MAKEEDNSNGIVAIVFGFLSILNAPNINLLIFYGPAIGIILGIFGIAFALKQRKIYRNKWATWGLWLSILGIVMNIAVIVLLVKFITSIILTKPAEIVQQIINALTK